MSSFAFARPMWPATLRALRELTRLALATLVLAVAFGTTAATGPTPGIELPAAPVAATVVARPFVEPIRATDTTPTAPHRLVAPARSEHAGTRPAAATAIPAHAVPADAIPADAIHTIPADGMLAHAIPATAIPATAVSADVTGWRAAAGEGEPTRRGPPTA
ncbi:hypothetical protein GCM10011608_17830 [Micromonospora sonchi]|uniref:Uncharacterized protein n=1 Tax=Micromonospora sonchi TaxID=1763543 RepID=A0A917TSZ3_9ACTN|nr:hypothetical protein [Micromonospora sonchi]GGM33776.1 hypothetical protein GCM10011608_17830 [Micromonospora sonchi]